MGWFQRTFSNSVAARIERAERFLANGNFNDARLELVEIDDPQGQALYKQAVKQLAQLNLQEARARFNSGDYEGAQDHLELAKTFGATNEDIRNIRRDGRNLRQKRQQKDAETRKQRNKITPVKDDPIWSLPPDHPRIRYAMRVENYPKELRKRLIDLGAGFAEAALEIEDGNPKIAYEKLAVFVDKDSVARFERARAAITAGMLANAISDLLIFGQEIGHTVIDNMHTGALLSQLMAQAGKKQEALKTVTGMMQQDQHPALAVIQAQLLEGTGNLKAAEKSFQTLLASFPQDLSISRQLARIKEKLQNRPGAAAVLESSLQRCCTPGKCGSQPMDVASVRMLARLYLEDRVAPERTNELLQDLKKHVQSPTWEDQYISALHARNSAQPFAPQLANQLLSQLSPNDPRRGWVERAFSASA